MRRVIAIFLLNLTLTAQDSYTVQIGSYAKESNADKLQKLFDIYSPRLYESDGLYVVAIEGLKSQEDAKAILAEVHAVEKSAYIKAVASDTKEHKTKKKIPEKPIEIELELPEVTPAQEIAVETPKKKKFTLLDYVTESITAPSDQNRTQEREVATPATEPNRTIQEPVADDNESTEIQQPITPVVNNVQDKRVVEELSIQIGSYKKSANAMKLQKLFDIYKPRVYESGGYHITTIEGITSAEDAQTILKEIQAVEPSAYIKKRGQAAVQEVAPTNRETPARLDPVNEAVEETPQKKKKFTLLDFFKTKTSSQEDNVTVNKETVIPLENDDNVSLQEQIAVTSEANLTNEDPITTIEKKEPVPTVTPDTTDPVSSALQSGYTIQVGSYKNIDNARKLQQLFDIYQPKIEQVGEYYALKIYDIEHEADAQAILDDVRKIEKSAFYKQTASPTTAQMSTQVTPPDIDILDPNIIAAAKEEKFTLFKFFEKAVSSNESIDEEKNENDKPEQPVLENEKAESKNHDKKFTLFDYFMGQGEGNRSKAEEYAEQLTYQWSDTNSTTKPKQKESQLARTLEHNNTQVPLPTEMNISMHDQITAQMIDREPKPAMRHKKLIGDVDGKEKEPITFYRAVINSVEKNPTVKVSKEILTQSEYVVEETKGDYYPQGTLGTTHEYYSKQQETTGHDSYFKNYGNVKLKQKLYDWGELKYKVKEKEFNRDSSRYKYQHAIEEETLKAAKAYLDVVFKKMSLKINRENMQKLNEIQKIAKTKKELGAVSEGDVASIEASYTTAQSQMIKIESEYYDAVSFYNHFVEEDRNDKMPFEYKFDIKLSDLKHYIETTLRRNLAISAIEAKMAAAQSKFDSYSSGIKPKLDLQLSTEQSLYNATETEDEQNHIATLKMSYQFLDGGKSKNKKEALRSEVMRQKYKLDEARRDTVWDTTKLYSSIASSLKTNQSTKAEILAARKMVNAYWEKYKLANQDLDVLINAQRQLNKAQLEYVNSLSTGTYGFFKLLSTTGELLEYIQNNLHDDVAYYKIEIE
jgi:outer membrane protein TolC/cell division septation protein DedD